MSGALSGAPRLQALDQIGIGDERLAERDQVGLAGREHLVGEREVVAVVGHVGVLEALAQGAVVERRDVARAAGGAFDDMDVDQLQRVEMIDDMVEQRLRIGVETPLAGVTGEMRMPVRSGPASAATALATSSISRARFSIDPP